MKAKLRKIKALIDHPRTEPILAQEAQRILERLQAKEGNHFHNNITGKPLGPGSGA